MTTITGHDVQANGNKVKAVQDKPSASLMMVSPPMAADWLKKNTSKNRAVKGGLVLKYAEDIRAGRWQVNGSSIVMALSGNIIDGQHRLLAIVEAGRPIETLVVSGVDDSAFETIDTGRGRKASDILSIIGYRNVTELAALARLEVLYEKTGGIAESGRMATPTMQEMVAVVNKNNDRYQEAIHAGAGMRHLFGSGSIWNFYWLRFGELDESDRDFFFERLNDGQGLVDGDPLYALRQALVNARLSHRSMPKTWMGGMIVKAWNKYRGHERVKALSFPATEAYPTPV